MSRMTASGPPVLGVQLLMGDETGQMLKNTLTMIEEGVLEPVELYAEAVHRPTS